MRQGALLAAWQTARDPFATLSMKWCARSWSSGEAECWLTIHPGEQLRFGITLPRFHQLLRDPGGFVGHSQLIEDGGGQRIDGGMPWSFDECGDKPLHDDAGQIRTSLKEIGAVAAGVGNFARIVWSHTRARAPEERNHPTA